MFLQSDETNQRSSIDNKMTITVVQELANEIINAMPERIRTMEISDSKVDRL